ncbi:MAG: mitochondrial nudix hydrolase 15 [Monoraphidium minutum]|nr:MAG: mitochondrial nudix hydrolase 15 [Monoraphidium minutum]
MLALFRHHILRALLVAHSLQRLLWMARRLFTYALLRVQPAGSLFMVQTRAQRVQGGQSLQDAVARLAEAARAQPRRAPVSDKHAGCLVPLFEDGAGVVRVWLTRRSKQLRTHAGEVCLPGGRRDEEDCGDDAVTALREAQEELGLDPSAARVVCKLPPFLSKHYLSVTPVVAQVPADFTPAINPAEVDAAFHMPLAAFLEADHHLHWDVGGARGGGLRYRIHSFDHIDGREHYVIWGLTASMLIRVAELAFGRAPAFEVGLRPRPHL